MKTPPFTREARIEAGYLLRRLQWGEKLAMPLSRPMGTIGRRCHELRIRDEDHVWRIIYRIDDDAIVILEVFDKGSGETPEYVKEVCRQRLQRYDEA
ncbi:MAG TPA: type II toxin-antitoxin system RelE/ParE family toxin [Gemmatimonadales bacterium]|nr:type II toxin-antitoxin system RelE/ParE family toxin [Gemmatimonadales bacterium]